MLKAGLFGILLSIFARDLLFARATNYTHFNVTLFQPRPLSLTPTKDYQLNLLENAAKNASEAGAQLLMLPELYLSGYNFNLINTSYIEPILGPSILSLMIIVFFTLHNRLSFSPIYPGPSFSRAQSIAIKYNISILYTFPEQIGDSKTPSNCLGTCSSFSYNIKLYIYIIIIIIIIIMYIYISYNA